MASSKRARASSGIGSSASKATSISRWIRSNARTRGVSARRRPMALVGVERFDAHSLSVGPGDDLFDPRLRRVEPRLAMFAELLAALVQADRIVERNLAALKLADDVLECAECVLEAHLRNIGALLIHARGMAGMVPGVKRAH